MNTIKVVFHLCCQDCCVSSSSSSTLSRVIVVVEETKFTRMKMISLAVSL